MLRREDYDGVYTNKIDVRWVAPERVAVNFRRRAVGGPAGVGDGDLRDEDLLLVIAQVSDHLGEAGDFADLLVEDYITWLVTIDANACCAMGLQ